MKEKVKWLCIVVAALVLIGMLLWLVYRPETVVPLTVYDRNGGLLLSTSDEADILANENGSYLDLAVTEAVEILSRERKCTAEEAKKALLTEGFCIDTAFDPVAQTALMNTGKSWEGKMELCGAITDLEGNVVAAYSSSRELNLALSLHSPHSSFKPLSVYAPALEKGILNWSSTVEDSPYSQIRDENGETSDWPRNATGQYAYKPITVDHAIQGSVNTAAVKWLDQLGVTESITFLQEKLEIPLVQEDYAAAHYGEQEVIGSIALGSLESGLSAVDMAGYYQIFANGGVYIRPSALLQIRCDDWAYSAKRTKVQALSPGNADIMGKLLQNVVWSGTGMEAACQDVEVGGKTGTGDGYTDNWFVGITPGYSCALWHGQYEKNTAPAIFSQVITELYSSLENANRRFVTHENLVQRIYCCETGLAYTPNCKTVNTGYFRQQDSIKACNIH